MTRPDADALLREVAASRLAVRETRKASAGKRNAWRCKRRQFRLFVRAYRRRFEQLTRTLESQSHGLCPAGVEAPPHDRLERRKYCRLAARRQAVAER